MNPLISEFSYGYALTEELAMGYRGVLRGAPIFPSLIEEGTVGGYDLELPVMGAPLFLQFKLSYYMKRSNAGEWSRWRQPYFRMHLRPLRHSKQHSLLLSLEAQGNEVYYACPKFHSPRVLNESYMRRRVVRSSVFFRPQDIGPLPDEQPHYVVFHPSDQAAYLHSHEPRPIRMTDGEHWQEKVLFGTKDGMISVDPEMFKKLLMAIEAALTETLPSWETPQVDLDEAFSRHGTKGLAAHVSYLARTYFDLQFFLISPLENRDEREGTGRGDA